MKDPALQICADLHTHSNASDGTLSPGELVEYAASLGLSAIALTDHDTLSGVSSLSPLERIRGIKVIPGIEISAEYRPGMLHLLGYFPSFPTGLELCLEEVQTARRDRIPKMIRKLHALGIMITQEEVMPPGENSQVGRPHVARALVRKGYVRTLDEAFRNYIGKGQKAYVPKEKMPLKRAMALIRDHAGLPVLAHPYTLQLDEGELEAFIRDLAHEGLAGIEVRYPEHTPEQTSLFGRLATRYGLLVTGGSDFHGPDRNGITPGEYGLDKGLFATFSERLMHEWNIRY